MNHKQMQTCQTASGSTMDQLHTSPLQHTQQLHCQEHVLTEISNIHENINAVDVNSENASKTILSNLSDLQDAFDDLSNLNITDKKHSYITDLAKEGSDYMSQAYDLFKAAYKENTFDADSADLAYQYLERASKRIRVIVTMLHGDVPDDVIIHE